MVAQSRALPSTTDTDQQQHTEPTAAGHGRENGAPSYYTRRQVEQILGLRGSMVRRLARTGIIKAHHADDTETMRSNGSPWRSAWLFEPHSVAAYKAWRSERGQK